MDEKNVAVASVRKSNIFLGVVLVLLCLFVWYETAKYPDDLLDARKLTGPGTFPRLLSLILGFIGLWEIIAAFRTRSWKLGFTGKEAIFSYKNQNIIIVIVMTAFFIPLTQYIGFTLGAMVYMHVLMARLKAKPWQAILSSLVTVAFVVVIFNYIFRVQLPVGILTEPMGWRY